MELGLNARWPLGPDERVLLGELAALIARAGAWRFLHAPVVAATTADYPDAWEQTRAGVGRVVARTLWHAHLDVDAIVVDTREPKWHDRARLRETRLELAQLAPKLEFELGVIGNDDVAGLISHEVGRAFVGVMPGDGPFRAAGDGLPDARIGSIATVYLGLGVVAANAAHHARSVGEIVGRSSVHEHVIAQRGGLHVRDLAFLLAVQATVRDDVLGALGTLHGTQAADVAAWRDVLDDHEVELIHLLGLATADDAIAPVRPASPRPVAVTGALDEALLFKPNYGRTTFRVPQRNPIAYAFVGAIGGTTLGSLTFLAGGDLAFLAMPALAIVGAVLGVLRGRRWYYQCASCGAIVKVDAPTCHRCGGTIVGEIKNAQDRLAREEEYEAAQAAAAASLPPPPPQ